MLVKISKEHSIFEDNPWLSNIPEFSGLHEKKMRYVAWWADYESPFRHHPDKERKKLCALEAGWVIQSTHDQTLEPRAREVVNGQIEEVNTAILKYRSLKPDENRDRLKLYQTQIENIKNAVEANPTDPAELLKVNNLLLSLPELVKSQRTLAKEVGLEDELTGIEKEVREDNKKRSTLAKVHLEQSKINE